MKPFRLLLVFIVLFGFMRNTISTHETSARCLELGFSENLLCSGCDKLLEFVHDNQLYEDCKKCCAEEDESSKVTRYAKAIFEICSWRLSHYPHIKEFVDKNARDFANLRVIYRSGALPALKMQDNAGVETILSIDNWKTEHIIEFLKEKLAP